MQVKIITAPWKFNLKRTNQTVDNWPYKTLNQKTMGSIEFSKGN